MGFCSRCGGRLAAESPEEKFLYRLRLIEQLIRAASESDFEGGEHMRRQVAAVGALASQDADLTRLCQAALDNLAVLPQLLSSDYHRDFCAGWKPLK